MKEISVALGSRGYQIVIGERLLEEAGARLAPLTRRGRLFLISEPNVMSPHGERLLTSLKSAGLSVDIYSVAEEGDAAKNFAALERLCAALLEAEIERGDCVAVFGGGALGDLAGLAAGLTRRGIDYAQIPTTLLAQVDSSVGGKTAINMPRGKNLIGMFHQPRLVLSDLSVLETLPPRMMRCGYAEIVKYGLLGDAGFFAWLEEHGARILKREERALTYAIARSCQMKAEIVARDEREHGERALLNLGHSFGHALETLTAATEEKEEESALQHGEAVAIGLVLAARLSARLDLCGKDAPARVENILREAELPTHIGDIAAPPRAERIIEVMRQDKKKRDGRLRLILLRSIGAAFLREEDCGAENLLPLLRESGAAA